MTASNHLQELIQTLRNQRRQRLLLEGGAYLVVAVIAAVLLWILITAILGSSGTAVIVARIIGYGVLASVLVRFMALPLIRRGSDSEFALYVEEHAPHLNQGLLAAVQEIGQPEEKRSSPSLTERVVQRAVSDLRPITSAGAIERPRMQRAGKLLAASFAAVALLAVFGPQGFRDGLRSLFAPWTVAVAAVPAPPMLSVSPGNADVPRGGAIDIHVALQNFGADGAELVFRSDSTGDWVRMPMGRDSLMESFSGRIFDIVAPTEYYVEAAGLRSASYRLRVTDLPAVLSVAVELRFPAYTRIAPERVEDGGDIAAVVGTNVIVEPSVSQAVRGGSLTFDDGTRVPVEVAADGTPRATFRIRSSGFYRIDLVAEDGRSVEGGVQYSVEALTDRAPEVRVVEPGRDTRVSALEEVTIESVATDDYGVTRIELRYRVNGGEEQSVIVADHGSSSRDEARGTHTLMLEEFELSPGDLVAYNAVATDAAGNESLSDVYFLQIRPWSRDYRQSESGDAGGNAGGGGGENPGDLVQRQREIVAGTYNWVRDSASRNERQRAEDITTIAIAQGRLREEVERLSQQLLQRGVTSADTSFIPIQQALASAAGEMKEAEEQLGRRAGRNALPYEERALASVQRADALYREVQLQQQNAQGGGGGGGGGQSNAEDLADLFEMETDRMRNQYEAVQRESAQQQAQEVDEVLERLRQLASRMQQENERMQRQAEAMRERMGRQGSGGGGGAQRELAQQAEEEARRLERLARERNSPELSSAAQEMQRAADAMRRAATGNESQGNQALEQLQRAARGLEDSRNREVSRDVQRLADRASALEERQEEIAGDVSRLGNQTGGERADAVRRLTEQKDLLNEEVRRFEEELDRVARDARSDQPGAASRLREAAEGIRESRVSDRIQFSRNVIRGGSQEYAESFEETITGGIREAAEGARAAAGALQGESVARRQERAMDQARSLVRGMESIRERSGGGGGDGAAGDGAAGGGTAAGGTADGGGGGGGNPRELGLRRRDAENLRELARAEGADLADLDRAIRDIRRLESVLGSGDPRGIAELQGEIIDRLKAFEFGLYRKLNDGSRQGGALGSRSPVPSEYRAEVEEYYRSLARPNP